MPNLEQRRRFFGNVSGSNQDAGGKEVVTGEERKAQEGAPVAGSVPAVPDAVSVREPGAVSSDGASQSAPVESIQEPVAGPVPGEDAPGDAVPAEPGQAPVEASVPERRSRSRQGVSRGVRGKKEVVTDNVRVNIRVTGSVCTILNRVRGAYLTRGEKDPKFNGVLIMALRYWLRHNERAIYDELKESGHFD